MSERFFEPARDRDRLPEDWVLTGPDCVSAGRLGAYRRRIH